MIKLNSLHYANLIVELMNGPWSYRDMAEHTGLHYQTVRDYVNALHKAGVAHIAEWGLDGKNRACIPHFVFGPGKDAKRQKLTGAQRQQRYKARRKEQQLSLGFKK